MRKPSKSEILKMLSLNLEVFCPELQGHFMCPTCLTAIPLYKKEKITEAHIIPKAAGGSLKTYLCKECNSLFGSKQDKWFGERVRLSKKKIRTMLATDIKDGYFWTDDVRINGYWKADPDEGITFIMHEDRNPPEVVKLMKQKFSSHPPSIRLRIPLPILKHRFISEVGYLTAGYLMFFGILGYSWILQSHLDPVRKQILNPDKKILDYRFVTYSENARWKPWVGLGIILDEIVLTVGIEDCLVLFRPADRPNLIPNLGDDFSRGVISDIRVLNFSPVPYYGPRVYVMFNDRMLVAPDLTTAKGAMDIVILFSSKNREGQILFPVTRDEFERLERMPEAKKIRAKHSPIIKNKKFWKD